MGGFVEKIIEAENGKFRLITAKEAGETAWFYVEMHPYAYGEYKRALKNDTLDNLSNYCKIHQSGWGEPPAEIIKLLG